MKRTKVKSKYDKNKDYQTHCNTQFTKDLLKSTICCKKPHCAFITKQYFCLNSFKNLIYFKHKKGWFI